ncbi:MAG: hypothetical protein LUE88_06590 [Clostridiales bacterium]|nr:hypothetical protein [Clostridiales bacterium]
MKTKMIFITICTALGAIGSLVAYTAAGVPLFWTFTITFGTCFYHFAVRLIVGYTIDVIFHNDKWDYTWSWFKQNSIEAKLYKIFKVKSWKKSMPTYNSEEFDIKNNSLDYVIRATCQAEAVHEINVVLSFVPIVFSLWVGDLPVFVITSVFAAVYDFMFVIIQRYNRPRLIKILERKM